jgi:hypothetical protein
MFKSFPKWFWWKGCGCIMSMVLCKHPRD